MQGSAVVEGDDQDEAEQMLAESLINLDASMCESFDVDSFSVDDVEEES